MNSEAFSIKYRSKIQFYASVFVYNMGAAILKWVWPENEAMW